MRRTRPTGRRAFTLVELLIVISLIAILAALSAGTLYRLRDSQNASVTEKTLDKLHSMLDTRWKVVIEDARKSVPDLLVAACGGDKDRAQVVWTYAKLKNEFPETYAEATTPVNFVALGIPATALELKSRQVFVMAAGTPTGAAGVTNLQLQSAALLYAALINTGGGGNAMSLEGTQQQVATNAAGVTYFKDGWNKPIAFVRHAAGSQRGDEINSPPVSRPHKVKLLTPAPSGPPMIREVDVYATFDPAGRFIPENVWSTTESSRRMNFINNTLGANRIVDLTANLAAFDTTTTPKQNLNSVPTLVSAGPNNEFGPVVGTAADDVTDEDDILSFRTRREGSRGN